MEEEQKTTTGLAGVLASIPTDTGMPTFHCCFLLYIYKNLFAALAGDSDSIKEPSK